MGEMKNKKIGIFATGILLVTLMASLIMAFGVAIPYWDSPEWYPLKLASGESKIISLTLQNTGDEDMTFRATITSGFEIATLIDENTDYFVASGEIDKPVNIKVEIPADLEVGSPNQTISVSFQQISSGEGGGMVSLATGIVASFPVEIVGYEESVKRTEEAAPAPKKVISGFWILTIIIIMVVILIVFSGMKKKKIKKNK